MELKRPSISHDVVISCAGEDRRAAEALVRELELRSITYFYDMDQQERERLVGGALPESLTEMFSTKAAHCVAFLSERSLSKKWTRLEQEAALQRASQEVGYLVPVVLPDTKLPKDFSDIAYLNWPPENAQTVAELLRRRLEKLYWRRFPIDLRQAEGFESKPSWRDMAWLDSEGWLCGAIEEGGGGGDVGRGFLLHTVDGGESWSRVKSDAFLSGRGTFTWGPQGTRMYEWSDIGPINAISVYKRHLGQGKHRLEAWVAAATGIYSTDDEGRTWRRATPPPDHRERYAFYASMANIEAFAEIYAAGWQGIAHGSKAAGSWRLEVPTYFYNITSVVAQGGSENRSVWAVGRAGIDSRGHRGDQSHGAIYHLDLQRNGWVRMPLDGINFLPAQSLNDLALIGMETVIAVGDAGLVLRGDEGEGGQWKWAQLSTPSEESFQSIAYTHPHLWIVGTGGVVLGSPDLGKTWSKSLLKDDRGGFPSLGRVRFFGDVGWIIGAGVVFRAEKARPTAF